ncbi:MAG TPA: GNAT family N-acetyltransferase [Planctomycetaceae bacterium]|jgi:ribosomal-protein-serine acetyltransferase|nr:GNAT family N-acetyltransferase [Planctomycetaceae bacterium]
MMPVLYVNPATVLRPVSVDDAANLFALVDANRDYLRAWLPWLDATLCEADTRTFITAAIERERVGGGSVMLVQHDSAICGVAAFNRIEPLNQVCEIGYWLAERYQGRGVMTGSVSRLVRHAFEDLRLNRITISIAVENHRSRAIPERLGFKAEGMLRESEWLYDHFVDQVLYALIRSDWNGSTAAT